MSQALATPVKPAFIPVCETVFNGNEKAYLNECIDSGWLSFAGRFVGAFEKRFAEYLGVDHALTCSNGTVALHLAMLALEIGLGDEVIVPTLTYVASANAIVHAGATPVFVDADPVTWNLDPALLEALITPKTKAIMVVHLYGHAVDMEPVLALARKHNLYVIEDAAEALGGTYRSSSSKDSAINGQPLGTLGDIGTFSFFANKLIACGEGGMVVTRSKELADKVLLYKSQGMDPNKRYWHPVVGYNYRMTNMQAAVGLAQLEKIDWHLAQRRAVFDRYNQALLPLSNWLSLTPEAAYTQHACWMYSILLKDSVPFSRDAFCDMLKQRGIDTRPLFYPMHTMPPYQWVNKAFPVAEKLASRGINLPTSSALTAEQQLYICETLTTLLQALPDA